MNRLDTLGFPDGRGNQTWSYHADGLPYQVWTNNINGGEQVINRYYYNKRRLLVHEQVEQPGWYTRGLSYGYDANGNLASQGYPTGNIVTYSPNALGQPTLIADTGGARYYASNLRYYPNGAVKWFTYGNNILHGMAQSARQLPVSSVDAGVSDLQTNFDANGNVIDIYDVARGSFYNRHMQYDGLDRLIAAGSRVFGGDASHRFSYDSIDNLKSWKLGAGGKDNANYYYEPGSNRLTGIQNSGGATVVGLAYDVQGNLLNKNGQRYIFDFGNRLREAVGKETYRYDANGRRALAWRPVGNSATLTQYGQSGQLMYYEKTGETGREHVYLGGSLLAIRETWSNTVKFQQTDALGSPVATTDGSGNVVERNDYEPYGAIIGKPAYDAVGYTGHKQDGATGLTYMQQRYYDPQIGRFLSVDPVTAYSNPVGAFNRHWYANNNPYRFTDPDGRHPALVAAAPFLIGGAIGVATDYGVQKYFNPDKPVNRIELGVAAVAGAVSGGAGGALVGAVARGTISVEKAVVLQTLVNGVVSASSAVAQGTIEVTPVSKSQVALGGASSAIGGLAASGIGVAMGDLGEAAAKGSLQRMFGSPSPGGPNAALATASTGNAIPVQSGTQAFASQGAQGVAQGVVESGKRTMEKPH